MAELVWCGRLRWFGHLERKSEDDWVSAIIRQYLEHRNELYQVQIAETVYIK